MSFRFQRRTAAPFAISALLAACAQTPPPLPGPVDFPRSPPSPGLALGGSSTQRPTTTTVADLPSAPQVKGTASSTRAPAAPPPADDESDLVSMAIEQTPLPMFIQILYGNVLKVPYSMDQAINARTDIVTFKTSQPISRAKLRDVAASLLRTYQISVQDLGGVIRLVPEGAAAAQPAPTLRMGKTLPETPEALRTAYQHVELDVVKVGDIGQWLRQILGTRVNVVDDANRNGFLLSGTQADLRLALELVKTLDQPRMRGRVAKRITPAFMNPVELSARLTDVLNAQGYGVAVGQLTSVPILIIPVTAIGSLIVFTTNDEVMDHVIHWARELDRPLPAQTQNGLYTYAVKYADAQELARTLSEILTGTSASQPAAPPLSGAPSAAPGAAAAPAPAPATRSSASSRVVVNSPTNTLIIRGTTPEEYQQIMALMRELDRPVKSALIEVVVAELRLGGSQALGIEWNINPQVTSRGTIQGGTLGRLGIGSAGLTLGFSNTAGQLVGILNTLASNNQARILSNPKVLARNGETAAIQVGQEVPVVTSQQSAGATGLFGNTGGVLQTIQYRSTGVILRVRPVINSGNRLDLEVSQEVSSAAETRTGVSASPTISTRRIDTKLSLRDGSTVLLGGLISRNNSDADTGIPYLKDIPGLGAIFKTQSNSSDQTELLIMITPYVISDDFESEAITDAILKTFSGWAQDLQPARANRPTVREQLPAPVSVETPLPEVTPPPAAPPNAAPAPAPASRPQAAESPGQPDAANHGVIMSRPLAPAAGAAPAPVPAPAASSPAPAPAPASGTAPRAPAAGARSSQNPPGTPVTDPQILKEIEESLRKQR